jgi:alkyl hydroperoxide reductase subunit AhpC
MRGTLQVLLASCDSKYCHLAATEKTRKEGGMGRLHVPLLADSTRAIAQVHSKRYSGVRLKGVFLCGCASRGVV